MLLKNSVHAEETKSEGWAVTVGSWACLGDVQIYPITLVNGLTAVQASNLALRINSLLDSYYKHASQRAGEGKDGE